MSRGDKDARDPTRLVTLLCSILLTLGLGVCVWLWLQKLERDKSREYHPHEHTEQTSGICLKLEPFVSFCPREQEVSRDEAKRANDDLKAQQEMADWAFGVVLISAAGFFSSIIGVILIWATFSATRRQVQIANEANDHSKHIASIEHRAYLVVRLTFAGVMAGEPNRLHINIELRNVGNTTALNVTLHVAALLTDNSGNNFEVSLASVVDNTAPTTLMKSDSIDYLFIGEHPALIGDENPYGHKPITVSARVEYSDVFIGQHSDELWFENPGFHPEFKLPGQSRRIEGRTKDNKKQ